RRRALPLSRRDPSEVRPRARAGRALSEDLVDAALPRVRGRPPRLPVYAVGQPDVHPERVEGPLLPDRRSLLRLLEGVLRRRRLELLGAPRRSALPQLQDALGLRALGRAQARREPRRRRDHGALAAPDRAPLAAAHRGLTPVRFRSRRGSATGARDAAG